MANVVAVGDQGVFGQALGLADVFQELVDFWGAARRDGAGLATRDDVDGHEPPRLGWKGAPGFTRSGNARRRGRLLYPCTVKRLRHGAGPSPASQAAKVCRVATRLGCLTELAPVAPSWLACGGRAPGVSGVTG